jgi:ribulose-phosphate 3-epimerase
MKVSTSILSANLANLGEVITRLNATDTDAIHIDVMDGVFVPNLAFSPDMVKALRPLTQKEFDVHLMMQNPLPYISKFAEAGADVISVHVEASDFEASLDEIKKQGKKAGVALNPQTENESIYWVLHKLERVLFLGVQPGFGGQSFMPDVAEKMYEFKDFLGNLPIEIAVDGGINLSTGKLARESGANILCAGSFITGQSNWATTIAQLKNV